MSGVRATGAALAGALLLLLTSGVARAADGTADTEYDVVQYGKDCARLIAEAPPFDCLDGEIVPITVDGQTPAAYTRHMTCDKPAYLPYPEKSDGQCTPYSRVRTVRDDDVQMLLLAAACTSVRSTARSSIRWRSSCTT